MVSTAGYNNISDKEQPPIEIILKDDRRQLRCEDDSKPVPESKEPVITKKSARRRRQKESSANLPLNVLDGDTETSLSSWKPDSLPIEEKQETCEGRILISLGSDRLSRSTAQSSMESSSPDKVSLEDTLVNSTHSDTTIYGALVKPETLSFGQKQPMSLDAPHFLSKSLLAMAKLHLASNDEADDDLREMTNSKKKVRRRHHHRDKNVKRISKSSSKLRKDKQQQQQQQRDDEVLMSSIERNCAFPAASSDIFLSKEMDREYEVLKQKVDAATAARLNAIDGGDTATPGGEVNHDNVGTQPALLREGGENNKTTAAAVNNEEQRKLPNCAVIEIDSPKIVSVGKRARKHQSSRQKKKKSGSSVSSSRTKHRAANNGNAENGEEIAVVASMVKKETVAESSSINHQQPTAATSTAEQLDTKVAGVVTTKTRSRKKRTGIRSSNNDNSQQGTAATVTAGGGYSSASKPKITVVFKNSLPSKVTETIDSAVDMRVHKEQNKGTTYDDTVVKETVKNGGSKHSSHRKTKNHSRHTESLSSKSTKDRSSRKVPEKKLTSSDEGLPRSPTKGVDIEPVPYDPPYSRLIKLDKEDRNGKSHKSPSKKKDRELRHRDYDTDSKVKHSSSAKVIVSNGKSEHTESSNKRVTSQRSSKLPKIYKIRNMNFNDHMEVPSSRYYDTTATGTDKKTPSTAATRLTRAHAKDNQSESKKYLRYHNRRQMSSCSGTSYSSRSNDSVPSSGQSHSSRTHSDLSTSSESPERHTSRHRYGATHTDANNDRVSDHGISSLEKENYKKPSPTRYKKSTSSTACHRQKSNDDFKRSSRFHDNGTVAVKEDSSRVPGKRQHKSGPANGVAEEEGFSTHLKLGYRRTRPSSHSVTAEGDDYAPRWQLHKLVVVSQTPEISKENKHQQSAKKQFQKQNSVGDNRKEQQFDSTSRSSAAANEKKTVTIRDLYSLHNVLSDTRNGTVSILFIYDKTFRRLVIPINKRVILN